MTPDWRAAIRPCHSLTEFVITGPCLFVPWPGPRAWPTCTVGVPRYCYCYLLLRVTATGSGSDEADDEADQ